MVKRKMNDLLRSQIENQKNRITACGIRAMLHHNIIVTNKGTFYSDRFTPSSEIILKNGSSKISL